MKNLKLFFIFFCNSLRLNLVFFFLLLWHSSLQPRFWTWAIQGGRLVCSHSEPSASWWRQRAFYRCFSLVMPFCTCFLRREITKSQRTEQEPRTGQEGERENELVRKVISKCETLASGEDISTVQGRADKKHHIISSQYGLKALWSYLPMRAAYTSFMGGPQDEE